jgi:hypothetical protein
MKSLIKYVVALLALFISTMPVYANDQPIADALMLGNKLLAVIVVLGIILLGILFFLVIMERRIKKMEDHFNQ